MNDISHLLLFDPTSACLAKKYLKPDYFFRAKNLQTKAGCSLKSILHSGVIHSDSEIGIYAGDAECYETFSELFKPILTEYHGLSTTPVDEKKLTAIPVEKMCLSGKEILSTRIRVARNLKDYAFTSHISPQDRENIEKIVVRVLNKLPAPLTGTYYSYAKLTTNQQSALMKHNLLFDKCDRFQTAAGMARDWPTGRGVFASNDHKFSIWINEEDHLRIISMQVGGDLCAVYKHLEFALDIIERELAFEFSDYFGHLTSCPSNIGTGLRASVHIRLPNLEQKYQHLQTITNKDGLAIRGTNGENSEVVDSVFDISNKQRFGISERSCLRRLCNGVTKLLAAERKLSNTPSF